VDFYLRWAESAVRADDQEAAGIVAAMGAVLRAGRRAAETAPNGTPFGVVEVDRGFPVWSRPFDEVVKATRRWTKEEYAEAIAPRLIDIARRERAPRVTPARCTRGASRMFPTSRRWRRRSRRGRLPVRR